MPMPLPNVTIDGVNVTCPPRDPAFTPTEPVQPLDEPFSDCDGCNFMLDADGVVFREESEECVPSACSQIVWFLNPISSIANGTFCGLSSLTKLQLTQSDLTYILPGTFADMALLTQLQLQQNKLIGLSDATFAGLVSLNQLQLNQNEIGNIEPEAFQWGPAESLTQLQLNQNLLDGVDLGTFANMTALEQLQLEQQLETFTTFPAGIFADLSSVDELQLPETSCVPADSPPNVIQAIEASNDNLPPCAL
jgi:hypothetical protein